jgi:orotidine-5'-phosphate decarboxylase
LLGTSSESTGTPLAPFGDRLAARVAERRSQIVLGIDPDPAALWPAAGALGHAHGVAAAVREHCTELIDAVAPACVAAKLQLACFERLGPDGWHVLHDVAATARAAGLLVIADGKRGDIAVSAAAYAEALFGGAPTPYGTTAGLGADAITVNPLMGRDSVAPFIAAARAAGAGVLLLVRTSNPGAVDVQDAPLSGGGTVSERLAAIADELGRDGVGDSGLSDVGAVVGATVPEQLQRLRALMPSAPLLLPGVGAQGGRIEDLAAAFSPGHAGGLVTASRSIVGAHGQSGAAPGDAALAEAERLRTAAWALV